MPERKKVLIIDDEIDLCHLLKNFFVKKGFEVQICHALNDGINFLRTYLPDILLLDYNLPDTPGWTAAPQLTVDYPDMLIVLMSAFNSTIPDMPAHAKYYKVEK